MKRLAVALSLLGAVACSTTIEGRVTTQESDTPIRGARVQIGHSYGYVDHSDAQGRFALEVDKDESYSVLVSAPSYRSHTQQLDVGDVAHLSVEFALEREGSDAPTPQQQGAPDVQFHIGRRSEPPAGHRAAGSTEALHSSIRRDQSGVLQGRVRSVTPVEVPGRDDWRCVLVTTESGGSDILAFSRYTKPARLGVEVDAEVLIEGRYAQVGAQRVLRVNRVAVDGTIRLIR